MARRADLTVLDARRDDERAAGGVRGSLHIPIHELPGRLDEVPPARSGCTAGRATAPPSPPRCSPGPAAVRSLVDGGYGDPDTGAAAVGLHAQPVPA